MFLNRFGSGSMLVALGQFFGHGLESRRVGEVASVDVMEQGDMKIGAHEHAHRMGVVTEALDELLRVLMQHRVHGDVALEGLVLGVQDVRPVSL